MGQPISFGPETNISLAVGSRPGGVAIADFNGDGRPDLTTANVGDISPNPSFPSVSIFLQNPNGTFSPAPNSPIAAPGSPRSVAVGDVNGDGKLDLAVAGFNSASLIDVSIFLGNGDGTFQPQIVVPVSVPAAVINALLGDFNRDGKLDLAVLGHSTVENQVSILLGNGNGTFGPAQNFGTGAPFTGGMHAIGDFNGDGKLDVAVPHANANNVAILLGDGNGNLSAPTLFAVGGVAPQSVAVADLNKDGILDLVTGDVGSGDISILFGNGNGTFQPATKIFVAAGTYSVAIGDLNGDGNLDIGVVNGAILRGDGQGNFSSGATFGLGNVGPLAIGDLDKDGRPDLVLVKTNNNQVATFLNTTTFDPAGFFGAPLLLPVGTTPESVAIGDFNRDGRPDIAVVNEGGFPQPGSMSIFLQNVNGQFVAAPGSPISLGLSPRFGATGDVNRDGILDLAVVNTQSASVSIFLGNGDGTFAPAPSVSLTGPGLGTFVALADLDLDGKMDLAVVKIFGSSVMGPLFPENAVVIYRGNGDGTFQIPPLTIETGGQTNARIALAIGDFNRDGKPDLAINNNHSGDVSVVLQNSVGPFGFGSPTFYPTGFNASDVAVGDFNGDGKLDLAVPNASAANLSILLGNGNGTFAPAANFSTTIATISVAVGDLNRDGKQDLAAAVYGNNTVGVLYGNGNGTLQPPIHLDAGVTGTGFSPFHIVVQDLNRDGKPDIVTANAGDDSVSILLSCDDCDGDGIPNALDNAPMVYNPNQEDSDTDGVGDVADNCPDSSNSNQADGDSDLLGNPCDDKNHVATPTVPIPPAGVPPGQPILVTFEIRISGSFSGYLIRPDCVNIFQEVRNASNAQLPLQERYKPIIIPDDLVAVVPGQILSVTCNIADAVSPESLIPGDYTVTGFYANDFVDTDIVNGVCTLQPCFPNIFRGIIKSNTVDVKVADTGMPATSVRVDIKFGTFPNDLNPDKKGTTPVTIFGSASLDVKQIDVATLRLAGSPLSPKNKGGLDFSYVDQDGDGRLDLVAHFITPTRQQLGLLPGQVDTTAVLTGSLTSGALITASDSLRIVKN
jgi:hypothetical protein